VADALQKISLAKSHSEEISNDETLKLMHHPLTHKRFGLDIVSVKPGYVKSRYKVSKCSDDSCKPENLDSNAYGTTHGGLSALLTDGNAASAGQTLLDPSSIAVCANHHVNFHSPIPLGSELVIESAALESFDDNKHTAIGLAPIISTVKLKEDKPEDKPRVSTLTVLAKQAAPVVKAVKETKL
jgi:acyl-coenzyme A thioesterase PaaI-like protein